MAAWSTAEVVLWMEAGACLAVAAALVVPVHPTIPPPRRRGVAVAWEEA